MAVGSIGKWWFANWISEPITALRKLRLEAHEVLNGHPNVTKNWKPEVIKQESDKFRRVAARIQTISLHPAARCYARLWKWDLDSTRRAFLGLANVLGTTPNERKIIAHEAEIAFRFPPRDSPERIERLRAREDQRED